MGNWGIRDVCAEKVAKFVPAIAILPAENEKVIRPILEVLKNDLVVILIGAGLALHVLFSRFTSTVPREPMSSSRECDYPFSQ